MEEQQLTTSSVINFVERLEDGSARFYEQMAARFAVQKETFLAFAKESAKSKVVVVRTYQETITDMLEACYCFEGLQLSSDLADPILADGSDLAAALRTAVVLEERASVFYLDVAARSQSLLATIPRAFRKVAETRGKRKSALEGMLAAA